MVMYDANTSIEAITVAEAFGCTNQIMEIMSPKSLDYRLMLPKVKMTSTWSKTTQALPVLKRFVELRENVKTRDNDDKLLDRKRHKDETIKEETHKRARDEVEDEIDQIKTTRMSKDQRYTLML
ncbi:hypothetical protein Tco_0913457 [Tanacetum coccineum]